MPTLVIRNNVHVCTHHSRKVAIQISQHHREVGFLNIIITFEISI